MVNAQNFLELYCPKERVSLGSPTFRWVDSSVGKKRSEITELLINGENLEGDLNLEGFTSLESFNCSNNQITSLIIIGSPNLKFLDCFENEITELDISSFPNLEKLNCSSNLLTNLDLSQNEKLEDLTIDNNNFSAQNLSFLSHLVNLQLLFLGNRKINHLENFNTYNRFTGSLEPLKNLTKLKELEISNTNIDSGLQHLPFSLKSLIIVSFGKVNNFEPKIRTLETELKKYGEPNNNNFAPLFVEWRIARAEELEIQFQELQTAKRNFQYLSIFSCLLLAIMGLIWISNGRGVEQRKKKLISRRVNSSF